MNWSDMMELAEQQNAPPGVEEQDTGNRISVSSEEASSPHWHAPPNNETNNAVAGENDDSSEGEDGSEGEDRLLVKIGGEIDTPAFALLDGVVYSVSQTDAERVLRKQNVIHSIDSHIEIRTHCSHSSSFLQNDGDDAQIKSVTIPITRLPATLGRTHDTSDPNFFGLGPKKAVSREQCRILYQDAFGGMLEQKGSSDALTYQLPKAKPKDVVPTNDDKPVPPQGFYAIECLGKNKIVVGKTRLEQGEVAQLESGTPIKISNYCLYFLLPTDAPQKTMSIPNPAYKKPRKRPSSTDSGPPKKKAFARGALKGQLEDMSTEDLIKEITALSSNQLGHRHKLIRSVVIAHGVMDVARAKPIRKLAQKAGGVSKGAIMTWLAESPMYSEYVKHTLSTLELESYKTSITKALLKAGFVRIGSTGRFVKWKLPKLDDESDLSDGDSEEAKDGDNDGPGKVSEGDDNDDQGIGKNDLDEDVNYNESDQEDEKEGLRENQDGMDEDSDDNESDHEDEKESLQQNRVVGKDDADDDGDDNENDKEDKKGSSAQSEGVGKDSGDGGGDSSPDDIDEILSPDKTGDKEIAVENEENSNNDKMDVMDDYSDSSNEESPEADNYKVESHESGKHMDNDLPASDGKGNENMDLDGDSVNCTGESVTKSAADDPMMGEKEAKSQQ